MSILDAIEWIRRDRVNGDPTWYARFCGLQLAVHVECEWCWEWTVDSDDENDLARGTVDAAGDEAVELDAWNYQNVEWAQRRCEVVARALVAAAQKADGGT